MKKKLYISLDASSLLLFLIGLIISKFNVMLWSILLLFVGNIVFAFTKIHRYFIFLLFNISMFLFLISRPFVSLLRGIQWWNIGSKGAVYNALISLYLSLLFMYVGSLIVDRIGYIKLRLKSKNIYLSSLFMHVGSFIVDRTGLNKLKLKKNNLCNHQDNTNRLLFIIQLQKITSVIFYIAIVAVFMEGYEKIVFMSTHTYTQYYTSYHTSQNILVKAFIQLMKPSLCIFLATMPTKKRAVPPLVLFLISTIPQLIVGMRSPTMLACMFIFSYYYLRDVCSKDKDEKWLGKREKTFILLMIPFIIVFLYGYNFWRNGKTLKLNNWSNLFLNFLYQQGKSFDVLVQGFDVMHLLPRNNFPGYMFGPIYDNFVYNSFVGRLLFGTVSINNQTIKAITLGHDMKAQLSYILMGKGYLQGAGVGTVHILEVIHDIGWVGLLIYNTILGMAFVKMVDWFGNYSKKNGWIVTTLSIYVFFQLYYTPRSDAIYMIAPIFSLYFWICVIICSTLAKMKISRQKLKKRSNNI